MKKLLMVVALALLSLRAGAQAANPQNTFSNAISVNSPSVWLNFNDATTAFKDSVSGSNFTFTPTSIATVGAQNGATSSLSNGYVVFMGATLPAMTVNQISLQFNVAPTAGSYTIVHGTGTAPSLTVASSFTVTVAATTAVQTFSVTPFTVAVGDRMGYWASSTTTALGDNLTGGSGFYFVAAASSIPSGAQTYAFQAAPYNIEMIVTGTQTPSNASPRQAGFDSTNNSNYSASFPYSVWNAAPNNTTGAFEWSDARSIMVHVDRLNWSRSGTLVLASKGDIGSTANSYWELYLQMNGQFSQVCFVRNGSGTGTVVTQSVCSPAGLDMMPNNLNYNIVLTQDVTGSGGGLNLYVNGTLEATGGSVGVGFGSATVNASGGTGYASVTPLLGVGGGPNCQISGQMNSTSGVPVSFSFGQNYGCTSVPSITFTFPVTSAISFGTFCSAQLPTTATSVSCTVSSVTAGSAILIGTLPPNTTSVIDTNGTPVLLAGAPSGQGPIYYEANVAAGTHIFTFTTAATAAIFYYPQALEVKGAAATNPIDVAAYANGTGNAVSIGPVTTSAPNEAVVAFMQTLSTYGSGWASPSSPFTLCGTPGNTFNCALGQAPTAGPSTFTVNQTTAAAWQGQLVAVKPLITSYAPTGTGVTLTYGLTGASMNSTTSPLMVPGYVSNGVAFGPGGTNSGQTATTIDEFAEFPSTLSFGVLSNIFYETKFYQGIANTATPKPVVIVDDDTFVDSDNELLLAMAIGAHRAGVITLAGVVVEDYTPAAIAAWRQMLDSAGLNDVPVTIPPVDPGSESGYATTNVLSYNANTPLTLGAWGYSTAMYRAIFAKYPTTPVKVMLGGPVWGAYAAFTSSAADSVSSLTGLQLIARNGTNGGAIYAQGWLYDLSANGGTVVANNQTMPIIWVEGTPMSGGPGALSTRTANDPLWMWFHSAGNDVRQCYDCLTLEAAISSYFTFSVGMAASGGTGYANSTPFTLSGTGANANCQGSGTITASGGVLNGVLFPWGSNAVGSTSGVGSGCVSAPTVTLTGSTGTGGTITAVPTPCGKYAVSGGLPGSYSTTGACANQYFTAGSFNTNQSPVSGAMMQWLINSWVDPAMPSGVANQQ